METPNIAIKAAGFRGDPVERAEAAKTSDKMAQRGSFRTCALAVLDDDERLADRELGEFRSSPIKRFSDEAHGSLSGDSGEVNADMSLSSGEAVSSADLIDTQARRVARKDTPAAGLAVQKAEKVALDLDGLALKPSSSPSRSSATFSAFWTARPAAGVSLRYP
jgi:hypothetical protein